MRQINAETKNSLTVLSKNSVNNMELRYDSKK